MRLINLVGQTFGRWVVVGASDERRGKRVLWRCRCACGAERLVIGVNLTRGISSSCGCLNSEVQASKARQRSYRHGHSSRSHISSEYRSWMAMHNRCNHPSVEGYENYGGRGITVCERWSDFRSFLSDMGNKPTPQHSIDRIDNDGNYEPGNCKWSTRVEQAANKRNSRIRMVEELDV